MTKLAFMLLVFLSVPSCTTDQEILEQELGYVLKIPEVSWMLVKDNRVFIGLTTKSDSLIASVLHAAALTGNRAINSNVQIVAVDDKDRGLVLAGKGYFRIQTVHGRKRSINDPTRVKIDQSFQLRTSRRCAMTTLSCNSQTGSIN